MENWEKIDLEFKETCMLQLEFLEEYGFKRDVKLEEATSLTSSVVYIGNNVGFIFSIDIRDSCLSSQVVKVKNNELCFLWEGGYSAPILTYAIKYAQFRGLNRSEFEAESASWIASSLQYDIEILKRFGQKLLRDSPDSLP